MRKIFICLTVFVGLCLASWTTPYYLGSPPNAGYENVDPEYGLTINDLFFSQFFKIMLTHRSGSTWTEPVEIPAFNPFNQSWSPALTGSGNRMYFCTYDNNHEENDDIYYSEKVGGVWQPAIKLPAPINTAYHENSVAISPNGSTLYFSSNRIDGSNNYEIYQSSWTGGGWSTPERMVNLCSPLLDKVCDVSSDGTKLYISRSVYSFAEGYHDFDLYVSTWSGNWQTPTPISELNTEAYSEGGATISPSNNYLAYWTDKPTSETQDRRNIWESIVSNVGVDPSSVGLIKATYK